MTSQRILSAKHYMTKQLMLNAIRHAETAATALRTELEGVREFCAEDAEMASALEFAMEATGVARSMEQIMGRLRAQAMQLKVPMLVVETPNSLEEHTAEETQEK